MRKLCLVMLPLALCFLLCSCAAGSARADFNRFREELRSSSGIAFQAELRAEYEDKTAEFTLLYAQDESGCTVTVVKPELIAGTQVKVAAGSTSLIYGDVLLDTGELDAYGLTPMSALPLLMDALREGSCDSYWREDGKNAVCIIPEDGRSVTMWFDAADMTPMRAELASDGRVRIYCTFSAWEQNGE